MYERDAAEREAKPFRKHKNLSVASAFLWLPVTQKTTCVEWLRMARTPKNTSSALG